MSANRSRAAITEHLVGRAIDAYLEASIIMNAPLPVSSDSGVVLDGGQRFVVLRRAKRILAVYEVSAPRKLRHLGRKDYPTSLEARDV
jgi:hypothetical protein